MQTRKIVALVFAPALMISWGEAAAEPVGTAFTDQGQLVFGQSAVTAEWTLEGTLWDAAVGTQIGSAQTVAVSVSDGLFTVPRDFGVGMVNDAARWLEIAVRCEGDPALTALTPRQELPPKPSALALSGLRNEQNATSLNVIGGFEDTDGGRRPQNA